MRCCQILSQVHTPTGRVHYTISNIGAIHTSGSTDSAASHHCHETIIHAKGLTAQRCGASVSKQKEKGTETTNELNMSLVKLGF